MIDLTQLAAAIISLCGIVVTIKVVPWIKSKMNESTLNRVAYWARVAVEAAEQKVKNGSIDPSERFGYARKFLNNKGYDLDFDEIEALIESSVHNLPTYLEAHVGHIDEIAEGELVEPGEE